MEPTVINVHSSTLIMSLHNIFMPLQGPKSHKAMVNFDVNNVPLPSHFSRTVQSAIDNNTLNHQTSKCAFVRECVLFYEGICQFPTEKEYSAISKAVVDKYPCLKDIRSSEYWVCIEYSAMFNNVPSYISYRNGIQYYNLIIISVLHRQPSTSS